MTEFERAVLAVLARAGGPCSLPYLDRHLVAHWDVDLVARGLLPACRALESTGLAAPTAKGGYIITGAGRAQLAVGAVGAAA